MAITRVQGTSITFSYVVADLFESVSLRSTYRSKNIRDEKGEAQMDNFAMSADERDAFNEILKEGSYKVFQKLFKMTNGITDSITVNTSSSISCKIVDNAAFNANILNLIDNNLEKALKYYCLKGWFEICGLDAEVQRFYTLYDEEMRLLSDNTFQLRRVSLS